MSAPKPRGGRDGAGAPRTAGSRVISDPRFSHAHTDPRFSRPRAATHSYTPDARFNRMFNDAAFGTEARVDKWGRKVAVKGGERLKKFYGIEDEKDDVEVEKVEGSEMEEKEAEVSQPDSKPNNKRQTQSSKQHAVKPTEEVEEEEDEVDEETGNSEEEVEEDADDTYSQSYLSSRTIAPPSSDEEDNDDDDDDSPDAEPASPTFPNILGSDSDSDIEPLYTQADAADAAEDEQPAEQVQLGDATDTLALVNMDWDRLRAVDIYMLCRSFVADTDGRVVSVAVYRSEYGKERMAEEEKYGPIGLYGGSVAEYRERIDKKVREQMEEEERRETTDTNQADDDDGDEKGEAADEGKDEEEEEADDRQESNVAVAAHNDGSDDDDNETPLDQEKLRQYEISRLRYFYAIIRCSSIPTATALYTALDASEFESSANKLDLRFVPSGTEFDAEDVRDECGEGDMDERAMTEYRAPAVFVTKALQHSRVELTWDADDEERKRKLKAGGGAAAAKKGKGKGKKGVEVDEGEDDLKVYLASDDEEDGYGSDAVVEVGEQDEEEDRPVLKKKARARYTALLSELNGQKPAATGAGDEGEDGEDEEERVIEMTFEPGLKAKAEELVKRVTEREERKHETAFEKRAREVREKKKDRKRERRNNAKGEDKEEEEEEEDVVDVDMEDEFFKGAFDGDEYMPVAERAKSFFADDERKERRDRKLNRETREKMDEDEDGDAEGGKAGGEDEDEKKRRAELELLLLPNQPGEDDGADGKQHYHLSQLIKANKPNSKAKPNSNPTQQPTSSTADAANEWQVDVSDPRFAAMYERADYSIDPTHPAYKPTREMERVMAERQRRRLTEARQREQTVKQRKAQTAAAEQQAEAEGKLGGGGGLEELVASVKAKSKARESEVEQRKRKDAVARKAAAAGGTTGSKRLGEQPLQANNKKQKLKGDMKL